MYPYGINIIIIILPLCTLFLNLVVLLFIIFSFGFHRLICHVELETVYIRVLFVVPKKSG